LTIDLHAAGGINHSVSVTNPTSWRYEQPVPGA
jgi:hypothetical protein